MRADDPDTFELEGPPELSGPASDVVAALHNVVTPERLRRIDEVVNQRTDEVALVLDDVHDPHNVSAMLRSADAFGVQRVYAVDPKRGLRASRGVSKGTHRWIDVKRFNDAAACLHAVRRDDYRVFVATMDANLEPRDIPPGKIAVVFGNEHRGASAMFSESSDGTFAIPMRGFVESLNVSVAAAVTLRELTASRTAPMSEARRTELKARFLMNSVKDAETVVAAYRRNLPST